MIGDVCSHAVPLDTWFTEGYLDSSTKTYVDNITVGKLTLFVNFVSFENRHIEENNRES